MQALGFICRHTEATPAALAAGVPAQVVGLAETTLTDDIPADVRLAVRFSCLDCMMQLCHDVRGMAAVRAAGAVPVLAKLLHAADGATIGKALQTLMGLSIDVESKLEILQVRPEHACATACNCSNLSFCNLAHNWNVLLCVLTECAAEPP